MAGVALSEPAIFLLGESGTVEFNHGTHETHEKLFPEFFSVVSVCSVVKNFQPSKMRSLTSVRDDNARQPAFGESHVEASGARPSDGLCYKLNSRLAFLNKMFSFTASDSTVSLRVCFKLPGNSLSQWGMSDAQTK